MTTRGCDGCKRLSCVAAGPGEVCLGRDQNPDPPEDVFRICFIEGGEVVRELRITPVELLAMRRLFNDVCDSIAEMVVLGIGDDDPPEEVSVDGQDSGDN